MRVSQSTSARFALVETVFGTELAGSATARRPIRCLTFSGRRDCAVYAMTAVGSSLAGALGRSIAPELMLNLTAIND